MRVPLRDHKLFRLQLSGTVSIRGRAPLIAGIFLVAAFRFSDSATAADYYIGKAGNDAHDGMTLVSAWATLAPVNKKNLAPGDRIFLEGGSRFAGPLLFDSEDRGTKEAPIVVTSFGEGRATIDAEIGAGVVAINTAGIALSTLNIIGRGQSENRSDGVMFYNDLPGMTKLEKIEIEEVEIRGFGSNGISIGGWNGESGFKDIRITRAVIHDNGLNGLITYARQPYSHERVYIGHVHSFNNSGSPHSFPHSNSGNGIVLGGVKEGTIEWSVADHNGVLGDAGIGIWTYDSTRVIIQRNESFENHTAGFHDGGGFALDGGVTDSVLQYNYSHDNDGAGYGLYQYQGAPSWSNNTVRFNLSIDDGRKNGYGGIHVWNGGSSLNHTEITENLIVMRTAREGNPSPLSIDAMTENFSVRSNILMMFGDTNVVSVTPGQYQLNFTGNRCWAQKHWRLWIHDSNDDHCHINHIF